MTDLNFEEIHDTLVSVALEAGRMILSANPTDIERGTKLNSVDIVTETDKGVEALVSSRLSAAYPDFAFMGEETYKPGDVLSSAPTFVVDPIDGTTNFVHAFPAACISAGLAVDRAPSVGVVYNPYTDVMFSAIRGRGAWMVENTNMSPPAETWRRDGATPRMANMALWATHEGNMHAHKLPLSRNVPPLGELSTALVAVEYGSSRDGANFELKMKTFDRLARDKSQGGAMAQGIRSLGSAALNLCAVAAGQLDAYWEGGCWAWDVCAGWCVLNEAGGVMASGNPNEEATLEGRVYLGADDFSCRRKRNIVKQWRKIYRFTMLLPDALHANSYHPILHGWKLHQQNHGDDQHEEMELLRCLEQSKCLATRMLETNPALHWMANLLSHDIFETNYHGRLAPPRTGLTLERNGRRPFAVVRHERARWARVGGAGGEQERRRFRWLAASSGRKDGAGDGGNKGSWDWDAGAGAGRGRRERRGGAFGPGSWFRKFGKAIGGGSTGGSGGVPANPSTSTSSSLGLSRMHISSSPSPLPSSAVGAGAGAGVPVAHEYLTGLNQTAEYEGEIIEHWKITARNRLVELGEFVKWRLDGEIWTNAGWAGYTCRVPRPRIPGLGKGIEAYGRDSGGVARGSYGLAWAREREREGTGLMEPLDVRHVEDADADSDVDATNDGEGGGGGGDAKVIAVQGLPVRRKCETLEMIRQWDGELLAKARRERSLPPKYRSLQVLVMREYAERLAKLERCGRKGGEEWLCTAFLAAVTMLHEIAHVAYWADFRSANEGMSEPFYGPDFERELGDSFIASIFGGWVPVPIALEKEVGTEGVLARRRGKAPTFANGVAWKQHLTMEFHWRRPKYRAHYSVPVMYIANLFLQENWMTGTDPSVLPGSTNGAPLIRPVSLVGRLRADLDVDQDAYGVVAWRKHATAAIRDTTSDGENLVWRRREVARSESEWETGTDGGGNGKGKGKGAAIGTAAAAYLASVNTPTRDAPPKAWEEVSSGDAHGEYIYNHEVWAERGGWSEELETPPLPPFSPLLPPPTPTRESMPRPPWSPELEPDGCEVGGGGDVFDEKMGERRPDEGYIQ
ncbi:hypothetical protein MKZ38_006050 [Zalerion maritima]|uniref:inositol-phosphate phosphatase n=1 Tax=Zalerion maritima TaxID=339359 RepID=A0AAD5RJL0_9PEZI|nr:hypothetical protein MKZ38_006050 [Zalerion maritima]